MIFRQTFCFSILLVFTLTGCKEDKTLFSLMSPEDTNILFENTLTETEEFNINEYLYAYNGGGIAVGDFNNDGLVDIYFTSNQQANSLYLNKGNFKFEDITEQAGDIKGPVGIEYWTTGVTVVDINNDGWLDIYVNLVSNLKQLQGHNQLFINNRDGTFIEKAKDYGLDLCVFGQQSVFFDYDLDGDLDMYQLNHSVHELNTYVKAKNRTKRDNLSGDKLFRNDGDKFVDVSEIAGIYSSVLGYGLSVSVSDLDGNGCPDIYVSNDFHENDFVYYNQCDGTFLEDVESVMGHTSTYSMGSDIADINNDGLMDIFTLDMKPEYEEIRKNSPSNESYQIYEFKRSYGFHHQYPRNMLQLNRGNLFNNRAHFSEVAQLAGLDATDWSWSVLLADFDNDTFKDIHITNGILRRPNDLDYINFTYNTSKTEQMSSLDILKHMPSGESENYAFKNKGNLSFENVSKTWGLNLKGYSMGSAYADLDNDGDLDLIVNNLNHPSSIYRNNLENLEKRNYIKVVLKGNSKNRNGIGTKVEVQIQGKKMTQELNPVRGWLSSSDFVLNFGLGKASEIEKVKITWFDGKVQELNNVKVNQLLKLNYINAAFSRVPPLDKDLLFSSVPSTELYIDFIHKENIYSDFNTERLMPHKLSTEGPKIAVSDVNSDGLEDFFIGGASGQASSLYLQDEDREGNPLFSRIELEAFDLDLDSEDVDAVFFDVDNDGDQDLYVVSGGGQSLFTKNSQDRLYINLGNGDFVKSNKLPSLNKNGACVVAADFNGDGFTDLFLGSRSLQGSYGESPDSYLLWNKGAEGFVLDISGYADVLKGLGMVTDAEWHETNKELIIVGEWMPITILKLNKNKIEKIEVPNSSGWWNTIYSNDIDQDGDMDFLVGNVGQNSILKPTVDQPIRLLLKDWDKNGTTDPLLTYYRQGKEWLFHGLDELKEQIPSIKNKYNSYSLFSNHTINENFSKKELESATVKTSVTFNSGILMNENETFQLTNLPMSTQMSPIYGFLTQDFNKDGYMDIVSVGNFFGNAPSLGNYDAGYGNFLTGSSENNFKTIEPYTTGFFLNGEARDIKSIRVQNQNWIFVSTNNGKIKIFKNTP